MEKEKEKTSFFRKFVGDKKFYLMVLSIAVPIMIQNGITNFVSLFTLPSGSHLQCIRRSRSLHIFCGERGLHR